MPEKLILVDGHSLMYRAFHALPLLTTQGGTYTNAVFGFLSMLFSALRDERPTYLGVAFDMHGPTFRHEKFEEYKAGRAPTPDELRPQFELIRRILSAMRIEMVSLPGYEADDLLGTLSLLAEGQGIDSLLITGDRDAFQLASEHTQVLYTRRGITDTLRVTPAYLFEQYGIAPGQLIDMKGLMGDKSDNIPGVPGVGEKTAAKLIREYGTLEGALDSAHSDQKGALRERLLTHREQAKLSKWLATIDRHAPVSFDAQRMRLLGLAGGRALLEEYELRSLLPKLDQLIGATSAASAAAQPEPANAGISFLELCRFDSAQALSDWVRAAPPSDCLALQLGTCASVALSCGAQAALALGGDLLTPGASEEDALLALSPLLDAHSDKVVHNEKALLSALQAAGVRLNGQVHDLMLAAYVLDPQKKSFALAALLGGDASPDAPAAAMLQLHERQMAQLEADELMPVYRDMELPLSGVLRRMEREGFLVDAQELTRLGAAYDARIAELAFSIYAHAGREFNINSPKQLGELLFDQLGLATGKKTKSGYSTGADVLEQLSGEHPIIPDILTYRKYAKLKSTYVDALLRLRGKDGRIHTSFDQTATATGRISSQEPNLQNIPVRTELGREIRRAFIAREGWQLVDADYSQIELRVLAHMSGDEVMREAFLLGQDIHQRTAAEVYGVPLKDVTKDMRSAAKAVNFGIVYGISDFGLARNIGVSRQEAKTFIDRYLSRYAGIRRFMDDMVAEGKLNGYVKTLFGRRRYLPELQNPNYNIRAFGERAAMNSPIQGTAADIIKLAMVRVARALSEGGYSARLILQVHDELIVEAPDGEVERVSALLKQQMEQVAALCVPLTADVSVGGNWDECK